MTAFLIADIKVTDDKWVPDYAASVHELVHKHGGKIPVAQRQCEDIGSPTSVLPRRVEAVAKAAFN